MSQIEEDRLAKIAKELELEEAGEAENPEENDPRVLTGKMAAVVSAVALSLAMFHLYTGWAGAFPNMIQRAIHLGFAFVLTFLLYPPMNKMRNRNAIPLYDWALVGLAILPNLYMVLNYDRIIEDPTSATRVDLAMGLLLVAMTFEAGRRTIGIILPIMSFIFVLYALFGNWIPGAWGHPGFKWDTIIQTVFMTTSGIYGTITGISATVVALFVLFGAILFYTGGGQTFVDIALFIAGRMNGGPAKVSCISSALFGTISGSAAANVVVDGVFNIPLMKKLGYQKEFAAAVEATASSGGQIMPPVMGAGAFIMAELLGIPYITIAFSAFLPAFLYYIGVTAQVHFEALKGNLPKAPESIIPSFQELVNWPKLGPLFVPIFILVFLLFVGYDANTGTFYTLAAAIILYVFQVPNWKISMIPAWTMVVMVVFGQYGLTSLGAGEFVERYWLSITTVVTFLVAYATYLATRSDSSVLKLRGADMLRGLDSGGRSIVLVATVIANASIIVAMVGLTGLGVKVSDLIISAAATLSFGIPEVAVFLTLFFAMIVSLTLGMGVSTTADYVLCASVVGPALIKLGVLPFATHMFLFYFSTISALTPPVCAAVFVSAALARANWWTAGWIATRLGIGGFIAPYMFAYAPELLLLGPTGEPFSAGVIPVIWRFSMAALGVLAFSAAVTNFFVRRCTWYESLMLYIASVALIVPHPAGDIVGLVVFGVVILLQKVLRPAPAHAPTPTLGSGAAAS